MNTCSLQRDVMKCSMKFLLENILTLDILKLIITRLTPTQLNIPEKGLIKKAVNSVGIHLVSLYFLFEKKYEFTKSAQIKMEFAQFNKEHKVIKPIEPPVKFEGLTVFDIWDNEDPDNHFELCKKWAEDAWKSWSSHHETIEKWAHVFSHEKK